MSPKAPNVAINPTASSFRDHAAAAEALIDGHETDPRLTVEQRVSLAQVHATLAVAEALAREGLAEPVRPYARQATR